MLEVGNQDFLNTFLKNLLKGTKDQIQNWTFIFLRAQTAADDYFSFGGCEM